MVRDVVEVRGATEDDIDDEVCPSGTVDCFSGCYKRRKSKIDTQGMLFDHINTLVLFFPNG